MKVNFDINESVALIELDDGKKNALTLEAANQLLVALWEADAAAMATAQELAKLPASAYAGNKLVPRQQALEIMSVSVAA